MLASWDKLNEKLLPLKEEFFSELNNTLITDKNYQHAQSAWKKFSVNKLGEYQDFCNTTDALSLSDVLGNFRKNIHKKYNLDPVPFATISSP